MPYSLGQVQPPRPTVDKKYTMLEQLTLSGVGPARHLGPVEFMPRMNLITGDNGLGKSFILDVAWWALTRTWARGVPASPQPTAKTSAIEFCYSKATGVHEERITRVDAQALVLSRRRDGRDERRVIARVPEQAADAGFSAWIADRLASLADGRGATLQFVVVGRLDQYRFRISPAGRLTLAGEPALRLRVQPDSLLRLLADPLELVYGLESRRLLRYQGPSNLPDPVTGEVPDVVISYDEAPPGAPARLPVP